MYGLVRTIAPLGEPLSLDEARDQCSLDSGLTAHDNLLAGFIASARELTEDQTGRALVSQTWKLTLDRFPKIIRPPRSPLISVTSIEYLDSAGDLQTLDAANYVVATSREPGLIEAAYGTSWPATRRHPEAVRVTFVCGHAAASAIPEAARQCIRLLVGHWFANREATIVGTIANELPLAVRSLLDQLRVGDEFTWPGQEN